jgi:hypothetical protein
MIQRAKSTVFVFGLLVLLACQSFGKPAPLVLEGMISDTQCALNVHSKDGSHDVMIKVGLGGANGKECTRRCVKDMGGKYVLVVKNRVYRLDDQTQPEKFAGEKVKVTATLVDAKTNTLHIVSMEIIP